MKCNILFFLLTSLVLGLMACSVIQSEPQVTSTPPPPTPTPTPTVIQPEPGVTIIGHITTDNASDARFTLKVSDDGQSFVSLGYSFTDLNCEGFSAGSSSGSGDFHAPITDGVFEIKSSSIGDINGKFISPVAAEGTVHLLFFDGQAECGTWEWSSAE